MNHTPLRIGDPAPDLPCRFADGSTAMLSDYWADRRLLLAFTRHLGCTFCREQLVHLKAYFEQLQEAGVNVIAVTMQSAEATRPLAEQLQLPFPCACDPDRELYRAYKTKRGSTWQVMGPAIWGRALRSLPRNGMGVPVGDLHQLHATVLIDQGGRVLLTHYPEHSADQLQCPAVLETVEKA